MGITPKQKKVLEYIESFSAKKGFAPTQQEIAKHFGFSSLGTVQNYLVRLQREGLLEKTWNAKRSLSTPKIITPPQPASLDRPVIELPLLGRVAAGRPIEAIDQGQTVEVPPSMIKKGDHYVLKVIGDSMVGDGILEDDYVVVKKEKSVRNGQTVVALWNNEATVKRFFKKGDRVELHSANPKYDPIVVRSLVEDFSIEGVVVGVIRHLNGL